MDTIQIQCNLKLDTYPADPGAKMDTSSQLPLCCSVRFHQSVLSCCSHIKSDICFVLMYECWQNGE